MSVRWARIRVKGLITESGEYRYEVSNYGVVRNTESKRVLKQNWQYGVALIGAGGYRKSYQVSVLVAMYFVENPNNYKYVIHIDGDLSNNRADNLAWSKFPTRSESRPLRQYTLDGKLVAKFSSYTEAADATGFSSKNIAIWCSNKDMKNFSGFLWRYEDDEEVVENRVRNHVTKVVINQYSLDGKLIASYDTMSEASRVTGTQLAHISGVCNRRLGRTTANGYFWRYSSDDEIANGVVPAVPDKRVRQYSTTGKFIKEFDSIESASRAVGARNKDLIFCCKGLPRFATVSGYIWRYSSDVVDGDIVVQHQSKSFADRHFDALRDLGVVPDVEKTGEKDTYQCAKGIEKPLRVYTTDLKFLGEFESVTQAALRLGVGMSGISQCCTRSIPTYKGLLWRSKGDDEIYERSHGVPIQSVDELVSFLSAWTRKGHILQYDLTGKLLREFNSVKDIVELYHCDRKSILSACTNKTAAHGFLWTYFGEVPVVPTNLDSVAHKSSLCVAQYTLSGELVARYKSVAKATEATGISRYYIDNCLKFKSGFSSVGGFVFKYEPIMK